MQFKELEWKDVVSDGITVCSHCEINLCSVVKMEFRINHESKENKYYLYCFGKGSLRRLQPERYDSVELAKNAAYRIYSNEMERIRRAIDYLEQLEKMQLIFTTDIESGDQMVHIKSNDYIV